MTHTADQIYMTKTRSAAFNLYTQPTDSTLDDFETRLGRSADIPPDSVNHPPHYANSGIECIDAMKAMMSDEAFEGFLRGNAFKYLWRYPMKNGVEDLKKAQWYLKKLIDTKSM
jgi:chlorite dismutase